MTPEKRVAYNAARRIPAHLKVTKRQRTARWRETNAEAVLLNLTEGREDESSYLAARVCRDFTGIMHGYVDAPSSNPPRDRFLDNLFSNIYWH